jgi:hypothetical protein
MRKKGPTKFNKVKQSKDDVETEEIRPFIIGMDSCTKDVLPTVPIQPPPIQPVELIEALGTTFSGLGASLLKSTLSLKDTMVVPFPEDEIGVAPPSHQYTYIKYMDWRKPRRQKPHPIPKCREEFYLVWQEEYETAVTALTGITVAQRISETIANGRKWCDYFCSDPDCLLPITSVVFQGWGTNTVPNSTLLAIVVTIVFKVKCVASDP